jgi:hypothetical protein
MSLGDHKPETAELVTETIPAGIYDLFIKIVTGGKYRAVMLIQYTPTGHRTPDGKGVIVSNLKIIKGPKIIKIS